MPWIARIRPPIRSKAAVDIGVFATIVRVVLPLPVGPEDAFVRPTVAEHFFREVIAEGIDETRLLG
jgi:hypothetical protein